MKRRALYSRTDRKSGPAAAPAADAPSATRQAAAPPTHAVPVPAAAPVAAPAPRTGGRAARFVRRHERALVFFAGMLVAGAAFWSTQHGATGAASLTQEDIDNAVRDSLENTPPPSVAAKAAEAIRGAVVRVEGVYSGATGEPDMEGGVGTGVVVVDKGVILTNMHVIAGAERVKVTFADGLESEATVMGVKPEHDLAVLQAKTIPDDLKPATLRGTGDLQVGDHVVAVGFPFGIGPSASAGVVSGLRREFVSPEGKRALSNLIQFDAAANPGNSGGPLVTADGQVVGIVTAILNPTNQRVFIGIGFAVPIENAANAIGVSPF
ncbi:MAG: trypsin-like peptidase domain-containing protein [Burkholderiales bacterium]|nr:trypsin-like peptidase domain-containing protein [Burkholderiales bacterium]